jgi:hypothetical protein
MGCDASKFFNSSFALAERAACFCSNAAAAAAFFACASVLALALALVKVVALVDCVGFVEGRV